MTAPIARLIPRVPPANPKATAAIQQAQRDLDEGLTNAVRALRAAGPNFDLSETQCEHVARIVAIHLLYALEDDAIPASRLCAAFADRLNREFWIEGGLA